MGYEDQTERLRVVWRQYAPRYDRQIASCERMLFGGGREWVCSRATGEVLEIAVGTGRNLSCYPAGVRLTGVDLSPEMLEIARQRAGELGMAADLREADATALPFPDASFDTVLSTLALCEIPDERTAIAEMYRVLRPGGALLLLDHVVSDHLLVRLGQRLLEKFTLRMLGDHQTRRPLPLVERAGFVIEQQERLKAGIVERVAARKPG